jgi:hypothetical protein
LPSKINQTPSAIMSQKVNFQPLPAEVEEIGKEIVDAAYKVHTELGPGLLEKE